MCVCNSHSGERDATETTLDIFNFKTLDQNLAKLEDLLSGVLETLRGIETLTEWRSPGAIYFNFIQFSLV